jgi:glutamine amidotransferase
MCRLLGIIANKPVDLEFSLERFKRFADWNPDGWGIGWYDGKEPKIFKQGISAIDRESKLPVLSKEVRSNIIITHIRKGTGAEPSERNSHPFKYKNWIFAHNGKVDGDYLKPLLNLEHKQALQGETDSEIYFHWLLQCAEEEQDIIEGIGKAVKKVLERDHSGLNFLLSDGLSLYAFRYASKFKSYYSLYRLIRKPLESGPIEFLSKETQALIRSKTLKGERALLVCSEKLTEEKWVEIDLGKLLTVKSDLSFKETRIL